MNDYQARMTMQAYKRCSNERKKQSSTHEEDQLLMRAIKRHRVGKWTDILRDYDFVALKSRSADALKKHVFSKIFKLKFSI